LPVNLRQIEILRAIIEAGSVTEAAARLHVSQPAVSKMLAQLERDLGFATFARQKRRLVPTAEGMALFAEVERAFLGLDHLNRFAADLRALRQGRLIIGATHSASNGWLPEVIALFLKANVGPTLSLQVLDSPTVGDAVARGQLDLGIAQASAAARSLHQERLLGVEAVCILPPGHRLAAKSTIKPVDLQDEPFIALAPGNRYRITLDALLQKRGIASRLRIETPLASTACALVMQGLGIAIIDHVSAMDNRYRGIAIRPFRPRIAENLLLLTANGNSPSLLAEDFKRHLRTYIEAKMIA
jgi:DNA-binding transcriptional LysR family regulator